MNKEICILNGTKWILGDESTEPMNWEDANNWCKSIGQDLPPREVLLMAFLNPEIRSKFANGYYWSSSEFDSYSAWDQDFNIGDQNVNFSKSAKLSVRAVRAIIAEASEHTEQEPVAWITEWVQRYRHNDTPIMDRAVSFTKGDAPAVPNPNYIPLYTAPPTREGLTPREGLTEYKKGYAQAELDLKRQPLTNENSDTVSAFNPVSNNYWSR